MFALTCASIMSACAPDQATAPDLLGTGAADQLRPLAFTARVTTRSRTVTIVPPSSSGTALTLRNEGSRDLALSLLGGDVVRMLATNLRLSEVGAFVPNKVRVTFDLIVENRLSSIRLVTPTWPTPPASGVVVFPIDYRVTLAPGGVTGTSGSTVIVTQAQFGTVSPSPEFDGTGAAGSGAPYNFFNDANCTGTVSGDCFRWKVVAANLPALGRTAPRTVGFDIDPGVAQFEARMIVAADLAPDVVASVRRASASGGEGIPDSR